MNAEKEIVHPAGRFSNRAENYMKFRPSYSPEIIPFLEKIIGLRGKVIADIGSGTGLFAEQFLRQGNSVLCIEPNEEMRTVAETKLKGYPGFSSHAGTAEETGIDDETVDIITVAQAFHWVDVLAAKMEFNRILKPGGHMVVAGTIRKIRSDFQEGYEKLKRQFSMEPVREVINEKNIETLFSNNLVRTHSFPHSNWLDFDSLKGLLLSSSGIPLPGHPSYDTMISSLVQLFVACNHNGFVLVEYETKLFATT